MKITPDLIARRNSYSLWRYEDTVKAVDCWEKDEHHSARMSINECKSCYYFKNDGSLQAFTPYICKHCEQDRIHNNSNTPDYCPKCCKEHNVCRRCGANV